MGAKRRRRRQGHDGDGDDAEHGGGEPAAWEEDDLSFPFLFSAEASLSADGAEAILGGVASRQPKRTKKVKGASAAAAEAGGKDAAKGSGGGGKGQQKQASSASAAKGKDSAKAGAEAGKGGGGKGGKQPGRRRRRRRRRGGKGKGGKAGKGAAGEVDYAAGLGDYGDEDGNISFPVLLADRMQDINIIGGSFITAVGKSIDEVSPVAVKDNLETLDAADSIVLFVFLVIFMSLFGFVNYYFQKYLVRKFLRRVIRIDPHEPFEDPTPEWTWEGNPVVHKVFFFPDDDKNFSAAIGEKPKNVDVKKTQIYQFLKDLLNDACCTVEMAMFSITSEDIAELLLCLDRKGVNIQIICDEAVLPLEGSQVPKLQQHGIDVALWPTSGAYMHHKFIIIDSKTVIYTSFNISNNAFFYNSEDAIVTNDQRFVHAFQAEFSNIRYLISLFPH